MNHSHQEHALAHAQAPSIPASAAAVASGTHYTCPMHPEIVRDAPGNCPICGMTLVPVARTGEADDSKVRDLTHRLWIGVALSMPPACSTGIRPAAVAGVRRRRHGAELGVRGHQCAAAQSRQAMTAGKQSIP